MSTTKRNELVQYVSTRLSKLANRRDNGIVTSDDVQTILDSKGYPRSPSKRLSIIRSVLNYSNGFFTSGYQIVSSRPAAKGRMVSEWLVNA